MLAWKKEKIAVVDFETTGINAKIDRVVEYGVAIFHRGYVEHVAHGLVNPQMPISEQASRVNGITDAMVKDAKTFNELSNMLIELLSGKIVAAYNAKFDKAFMVNEFARTSKNVKFLSIWIDPLIWVRHYFKYEKSKKLTDICKLLKIEITNAHRASGDAEATGRILYALADRMPDDYEEMIEQQICLAHQQKIAYQAWKDKQKTEETCQKVTTATSTKS